MRIARRADQVLNTLPVLVCYIDPDKRLIFANNAYKDMFGFAEEEVKGRKLQDVLGEAAFLRAETHIDLALQGQPSEYENAERTKTGELRGLLISYVPDFDDAGVVKGVIVAIVDISDQLRTQIALEESEDRLNLSLDAGSIGTWTWNLVDGSHFWDDRMVAMTGMVPDALTGIMEDDFVKSLHPDDVAMVEEAVRRSLEEDVEYNVTYRILRRDDGKVRDINALASVVRNDTGQAIRMTGVAVDVTKQKQSAAELQAAYASLEERVAERTEALGKSNQRMQEEIKERMRFQAEKAESEAFVNTVLSNMVDALITIDKHGLVSSFNQAAENIFGYSAAQVHGQNITMLMPDPDRTQHDRYLSDYVATGRSKILGKGPREVIGRHKNGGSLFLELSISEVVFGGRTLFIGALRDISERKRLQALFDRVAENSPNSILLKDLDGRVVLVNRLFEDWTGLSASDVVGKTPHEIYPSEYAERVIASDQRVVRTGKAETEEWSTVFADGVTHHLMATSFPVMDADNNIIGVGTISVDATDLRATELQLRRAQKMEAIGQLTGGIAHDFNNLLAIMLGNLSLLGEELGPDHGSAVLLTPTLRAIDKASALTARMLAFSRQQPLDVHEVDVNELLHNIQPLIKRSLMEDINIEFGPASEQCICIVDPGQLEQAILNLSINARDAMPRGGRLNFATTKVTIGATDNRPDNVTPGNYVMITVSDNGQGISSDNVERIFDPFFTTKGVGKGSGLGLSMVYGFVKQSNGHVTVASRENEGTTFKIFLPAGPSALPGNSDPFDGIHEPFG
ncbi:MAG: PAS domain S-box protein [Rhodospirillaceae bacterium]|nr:PAS domain S-box protein [Rhodospirillaceae bacterium]MBT4689529.1 PAS domain S-box protein [Rhodospirillaceae bacterium]MBT5080381.1 PAS domain S-box protein [Rhodospirillaceae bacterium]MBT5522739.1 PAS domain S-box protein [Rhodospirillaceae bacterium]MBT5878473.1 PAS domain S-box protein [Rhodospirillaceae bacterium]